SARAIKGYESGTLVPSKETLRGLAHAVGFPEAFLEALPIEPLPIEAASFRALSKASARIRNKAVASGTFAVSLLYPFLSERFELPRLDLPDLREESPA